VSPTLVDPVGHETDNTERSRNRGTLEVFGFSALILRENSNSYVETGQTGQTTEDKESQENVIERCANT